MKGMMGNMNGKIELDKIVGCFKKDGISVTFILTNPFHYHLSLCVRCVGLYLAYLHYFLSALCVSWEPLSLSKSNQKICDLYK